MILPATFNPHTRLFGYDATEASPRRSQPVVSLRSEDRELVAQRRRKLVSSTRDARRNFSIAAWAIRKHLDFVATFSFQSRSGVPELDQRVEELIGLWSRPLNFDAAGCHGLAKFIRLAEASRTVDGDVFMLKLRDGRLQAIESDRVRTHKDFRRLDDDEDRVVHGVRVSRTGRPLSYQVHRRSRRGVGFEHERNISATNMFRLGYYDRFDQVRGISPIASALNSYRDIYEGIDYALARAKVSQLFGMAVKSEQPVFDGSLNVDLNKGPITLQLDPGDDAQFLESRQPSGEFMNLMQVTTAAALKSLDIPFSFYDESFTNFFGPHANQRSW